ncbi:DUF805 domain-containing protein [Companilactobacillus sp. DQM5]|uniref:DUF805 domain-containing protein n=1 Tax=Companilactobacillus sp. DQM5 TaxID=3463359 RepID=UPI004058AF45
MIRAYKDFWKKYIDFKGKSTVTDYWWSVLGNVIISILLIILMLISFRNMSIQEFTGQETFATIYVVIMVLVFAIWLLALIIPNIAIRIRRFRDAGLSPWWTLLVVVPTLIPIFSVSTLAVISSQILNVGYGFDSSLSFFHSGLMTTLVLVRIVLGIINFGISIFFFIASLLPTKKEKISE